MKFFNNKTLFSITLSFLTLYFGNSWTVEETIDPPWKRIADNNPPLGEAQKDYTPTVVPNGKTATFRIVDGVKVFHLIASQFIWDVSEGLAINVWGYNHSVPGPLIEVAEGDRVRIYVTNKLPAPTTVHWHGILLPCGMDGIEGITQPSIKPGETFVYEFIFANAGTYMYHPHTDSVTQLGMGLTGMIVVHKREPDPKKRPQRDFAILLHEWSIKVGTARPDTTQMSDFNILTMNGKVMPSTEPLVAKTGDRVWIRFGNLSQTDHHPIHLHGHVFKVIGTDGGFAEDISHLLSESTVLVPVGAAKVIEFIANNPGDWIFHCHMTHHMMNQMGHESPNMLGVEMKGIDEKIAKLIPGFMVMGTTGMMPHSSMHMSLPPNSIPMLGIKGQFGQSEMGGMASILKIRDNITSYEDPGPYVFPQGTVAWAASPKELERDGIDVSGEK